MSGEGIAAAGFLGDQHFARRITPIWIEKQLGGIVAAQIENPIAGYWRNKQTSDPRPIALVAVIRIHHARIELSQVIRFLRVVREARSASQIRHVYAVDPTIHVETHEARTEQPGLKLCGGSCGNCITGNVRYAVDRYGVASVLLLL